MLFLDNLINTLINLLPENSRRLRHRDYRMRFSTTILFVLGVLIFLFSALVYPIRLQLRAEAGYQQARIPKKTMTGSDRLDGVGVAEEINRELRILSAKAPQGTLLPHEAVDLMLLLRGNIKISSLTFNPKSYMILFRGEAGRREDLVSLSDRLLADARIATIDLPIATLLPERNINFTMTIGLKKPDPNIK